MVTALAGNKADLLDARKVTSEASLCIFSSKIMLSTFLGLSI